MQTRLKTRGVSEGGTVSEILTLQVRDHSPEQFGCMGPEMFNLHL